MNELNNFKYPIIVAISGASGTIYGIRFLQFLLENNYKVEMIISHSACKVASDELDLELSFYPEILKEQVLSYLVNKLGAEKLKDKFNLLNVWAFSDISASISSGSYKTSGMIIIPASMGTVASIANGISNNLITRAADVCLKERRRLVVLPREMPFSTIHLENLLKLSKLGAIIAPASPGFYSKPVNISDVVDFVAGKALDLFGIEHEIFKRWSKDPQKLIL